MYFQITFPYFAQICAVLCSNSWKVLACTRLVMFLYTIQYVLVASSFVDPFVFMDETTNNSTINAQIQKLTQIKSQ